MRAAIVVTVLWAAGSAGALETLATQEDIDFDRPEAWAMKYFASLTLMTGMGPPRAVRLGSVRLALDGEWVPQLDDRQRTVGFNGTKRESLNQTPFYGHPRLEIGLPFQVTLTLSYLPPIPIAHLQANLFAFSLARPIILARGLTVGVRAFGQVGSVKGSFTCSEFAIARGGAENAFACTKESHDQVDLNYGGVEVSGGYKIRALHGLEPYAAVGGDYMNLRFRVGAQYANVDDRTVLKTDGATWWTTAGVLFPVTDRFDIGTEVFYSPLTVRRPPAGFSTLDGLFNVRAQIAYRFY